MLVLSSFYAQENWDTEGLITQEISGRVEGVACRETTAAISPKAGAGVQDWVRETEVHIQTTLQEGLPVSQYVEMELST